MPYIFASLGDLGRLPADCPSSAIGKLQEKLKAKGLSLGRKGVDCRWGDDSNAALTQWIAGEAPAAAPEKYLERIGLSSANARKAVEKIATWLEKNPGKTWPFVPPPATGTGTTGTTAGTGIGTGIAGRTAGTGTGIRITPSTGVVPGTGERPPKPPPGEPPTEQPPFPPPETPAGRPAAIEPWYSTYRWWLVGGSAALVLGTLVVVLATRRKR